MSSPNITCTKKGMNFKANKQNKRKEESLTVLLTPLHNIQHNKKSSFGQNPSLDQMLSHAIPMIGDKPKEKKHEQHTGEASK